MIPRLKISLVLTFDVLKNLVALRNCSERSRHCWAYLLVQPQEARLPGEWQFYGAGAENEIR